LLVVFLRLFVTTNVQFAFRLIQHKSLARMIFVMNGFNFLMFLTNYT